MDLYEFVIPAVEAIHSWNGTERVELTEGDEFKIESDGVDILRLPIPVGKTYSIRIRLTVEEV